LLGVARSKDTLRCGILRFQLERLSLLNNWS
jgi:hypothetical protein